MKRYFNYRNYSRYALQRFSKLACELNNRLNVHREKQEVRELILKATGYQAIDQDLAMDHRTGTPHGQPTILDETLNDIIEVEKFRGRRVLEIGPKWGHNSLWVDRNLQPSEFVLIDLPKTKDGLFLHGVPFQQESWLSQLRSPRRIIYDNLITCKVLLELEPFDLILCVGVLYHNIEQLKILNVLRRLMANGGILVLQTSIYLGSEEAVVHYAWYPGTTAGVAFPTKYALLKMLAMTGWTNVKHYVHYKPASNSVLIICEKAEDLVENLKDGCPIGGSTI